MPQFQGQQGGFIPGVGELGVRLALWFEVSAMISRCTTLRMGCSPPGASWLPSLLLMGSTLPTLGPVDGSTRRPHGGPSLQVSWLHFPPCLDPVLGLSRVTLY